MDVNMSTVSRYLLNSRHWCKAITPKTYNITNRQLLPYGNTSRISTNQPLLIINALASVSGRIIFEDFFLCNVEIRTIRSIYPVPNVTTIRIALPMSFQNITIYVPMPAKIKIALR